MTNSAASNVKVSEDDVEIIRAMCPCGLPFDPMKDHQGNKKRGGLPRLYCCRKCTSKFVAVARRERANQERLRLLREERRANGYLELQLA